MVKFTRQHYEMICEMLKEFVTAKVDPELTAVWVAKWDNVFRADNPRYQSDKFKACIFED